MDVTFAIDWKVAVALGATAVAVLLVEKMDASAVESVSTILAEACRELATAGKTGC